jgi:predicted PurR-regulated permease PerM
MQASNDSAPDPLDRSRVASARTRSTRSIVRQALPIYVALLLAILSGVAILLLWMLRDVMLLLFISVLFAAAVSGPSTRLERLGIPRGIAALMVYAIAFAVVVAIGWFVIPPTIQQVARLAEQAPEYAERYQRLRQAYDELSEDYPELGSFDEQFASLRERVINSVSQRLIDLPARTFAIFLNTLSVFVISMLIVTSRERLLAFVLSMVHPDYRDETRDVLQKMWQRIGHYIRAKLIVMTIVGAITYVALRLIGVPYPLFLSIIVAFGEVIPRVGPWLARIPLLGIALLEGWTTFVLTFVASVVIENAKGLVISPFVEGDQLDIPPLLVFTAVLAGAALLGPAGAFVAVPFAAMVQVLFEEIIIPWRRQQFAEVESSAPRAENR